MFSLSYSAFEQNVESLAEGMRRLNAYEISMVGSAISYASLSALPPETSYIQIMYFCWENKTLNLNLNNVGETGAGCNRGWL